MTNNRRSLLISLFLGLILLTMISFLFTQGRFSEETGSEDGIFGSDLEYIVSNGVLVKSVEELISAIENGYSNVKIDDSVENPLVITSGITDVGTDLILDLNGHELQRNNREPMLNITEGIRMTIIDSSKSQKGSFYNPVGSVLRVSGGTLTVQAGLYESGPRDNEYAKQDGDRYESDSGGSISLTNNDEVNIFAKSGESYTSSGILEMPIITPYVAKIDASDGGWFVNGNMYLAEGLSISGDTSGGSSVSTNIDTYYAADTYLYYTVEDGSVIGNPIGTSSSADFYYSYWVEKTEGAGGEPSYTYVSAEKPENLSDGHFEVKVYGYRNVMAYAENKHSLVENQANTFAAIQMNAGNLYCRGGDYRSYFGVGSAYCVYASGGYMAVERGDFTVEREGVCVSCDFEAVSPTEYLRIADGNFQSFLGDTLQVNGGRLVITGGTFAKDASAGTTDEDHGAIVAISGGQLTVGGAETIPFTLTGSHMAGIRAESGTGGSGAPQVEVVKAAFNFVTPNSLGNVGISAAAGVVRVSESRFDLSGGGDGVAVADGEVTVSDTAFSVSDGNSRGIYAEAGTVTAEICTLTLTGASSRGIYAADGEITARNCSFVLEGNDSQGIHIENGAIKVSGGLFRLTEENSRGIYAEAGTVNVNANGAEGGDLSCFYIDGVTGCYGVYAGGKDSSGTVSVSVENAQFFMGQTGTRGTSPASGINGAGIYMNAGGSSAVTLENVFIVAAGHASSGVYAERGTIRAEGDLTAVTGARLKAYESGVTRVKNPFAYGVGETEDPVGSGEMKRTDTSHSYGVYSAGGSVAVKNLFAGVYGGYSAGILALSGSGSAGGIRVGGALKVAVDISGNALSSTAVSAENSHVTILGNAAIRTNGLGITVRSTGGTGSNLTFGAEGKNVTDTELVITSARGTAVYVNNGSLTLHPKVTANITSDIDADCGWVTPPGGALSNGYDVYNGVYVQGGSLKAEGFLKVTQNENATSSDTRLQNKYLNASGDSSDVFSDLIVTSHAVRVEGSDNSAVTIQKGTIVNHIGGGVYVSGDGTVTLGIENVAQSNQQLSVQTLGKTTADDFTAFPGAAENWKFKKNLTGGDAVEVSGGTLTIHGGSYSAAMGNGILVRSGVATVNDGKFVGNDSYKANDGGPMPGAAASYAFKMYGGEMEVYGGTFGQETGSTASGAFVMGLGDNNKAEANIYAGTFKVSTKNSDDQAGADSTENSGGQTGFSVYHHAIVTFGKEGSQNGPALTGLAAGLAVESASAASEITIYGGTFQSTKNKENSDGIWFSNPNAELNIYGGTFEGAARSGLRLANHGNGKVYLEGGAFKGKISAIEAEGNNHNAEDLFRNGKKPVDENNNDIALEGWFGWPKYSINSSLGQEGYVKVV